MHTLAEVFLVEKTKGKKKEDKPKKSKKKQPGRKPRKKTDVAALEAFIAQTQRLKGLLEAKKEYDRIHRQLKQGKHGQSKVVELMRQHFANAFKDAGDAYDEALEPILRLEKIAVKMKSKEMRRADAARVLSLLKEKATPVIQKAIAKAEALAEEDPTRIFYEEWELMDVAESYGFRQDGQILQEGMMDWLKSKGKALLGKIRGTTKWFRSKLAPVLSSIATEIEAQWEEEMEPYRIMGKRRKLGLPMFTGPLEVPYEPEED